MEALKRILVKVLKLAFYLLLLSTYAVSKALGLLCTALGDYTKTVINSKSLL